MTTRDSPVVLPPPKPGDDAFHFAVLGDRTGGVPAGLKVLEQAVADTNLLDPDLVMTVGDLIQGYSDAPPWLSQMREYKDIVDRLNMKWYPVAGNHDIYWRGQKAAPAGHHESNYEKHFGPLWYSFRHKNAGFVVLYSDEGDAQTNLKAFNVGMLQNMSSEQLAFLDTALADLSDADHVFVFLHHPRWIGGGYLGCNWPVVEKKLIDAGNVSAVFAGHIHHIRYDETDRPTESGSNQGGIEYYTLGATGAHIQADIPDAGFLHHFNMVTVRKDRVTVATLPVGSVIDPKQFTPEFLAEVEQARKIRPRQTSPALLINADGSCQGEVVLTIKNPTSHDIDVTISNDPKTLSDRWMTTLDHRHFEIKGGSHQDVSFMIRHEPPIASTSEKAVSAESMISVPSVQLEIETKTSSARVRLPAVIQPLELALGQVPADYFTNPIDRCLRVDGAGSAIRIPSNEIELPDGPMTLESWVRPKSLPGYRAILAKTESSEYSIFSDEGVPQFSIHLDGRYVVAKATKPMLAGKWTHLAGVYDGESVSLYVDGERVDQQKIRRKRDGEKVRPVKQRHNKLPFFIGADPDARGNPSRSLEGWIDEVRLSKTAIYSDAFEPQQRHSPSDDTVFLFHLDRSVGPFVLDHSHHATTGLMGTSSGLVLNAE